MGPGSKRPRLASSFPLHANGISTPTRRATTACCTPLEALLVLGSAEPIQRASLTTNVTAARDSSPTVRSLRSQISAMHGQALAHSAQRSTGALVRWFRPIRWSSLKNKWQDRSRPPAAADTTARTSLGCGLIWRRPARASETWWCAAARRAPRARAPRTGGSLRITWASWGSEGPVAPRPSCCRRASRSS